jgi:hypothetical protein
MKTRTGYVSNSSSSSFIVAIKKDYTWELLIEDSGPMSDFAEKLADWLAKECPQLQSIENFAFYVALGWEGEDYAKEAVEGGEFDWLTNRAKSMVEKPEEWFFGYGSASYNDGDAVELFLGYGGTIDSKNFKLKGFGN